MSDWQTAVAEYLENNRYLLQTVEQIHHYRDQRLPEDIDAHLGRLESAGDCNECIIAFMPGLELPDPVIAARIALLLGVLVENGGDPDLAVGAVLQSLRRQFEPALRFAALLLRDFDVEEPMAASMEVCDLAAEKDMQGYKAWTALDEFLLPAMTMLSRSVFERERARTHHALPCPELAELAEIQQNAWFLYSLLSLSDRREVLVLHPEMGVGFRVETEAVHNCFHFFSLLQGILLEQELMPGEKIDPFILSIARGNSPSQPLELDYDRGLWGFGPWFALGEKGLDQHLYIGGEHEVRRIPVFEGETILVLGAAEAERTWHVSFFPPLHEALRSAVHVREVLEPEEVEYWTERLRRYAAARDDVAGMAGCAVCRLAEKTDPPGS